jgi:CheY-like chemotaxis protein
MTRVFVLDDHDVVRRGLKELLEDSGDIEVVGEAGTAVEARSGIHWPNQMSRCSMSGCPTAAASRSAVRFAYGIPRSNASC